MELNSREEGQNDVCKEACVYDVVPDLGVQVYVKANHNWDKGGGVEHKNNNVDIPDLLDTLIGEN